MPHGSSNWKNTFVKKDPSLWVFSGFNKKGYMDNSKYLYEYVLEHYPEIQAVWLTLDKAVLSGSPKRASR